MADKPPQGRSKKLEWRWQIGIWWLACGLYLANIGVGIAAQWGRIHFGWLHHALFFAVFVSACAATLVWCHPLMGITLAALCYLPTSQPGTWKHPTAALLGLCGYVASIP